MRRNIILSDQQIAIIMVAIKNVDTSLINDMPSHDDSADGAVEADIIYSMFDAVRKCDDADILHDFCS